MGGLEIEFQLLTVGFEVLSNHSGLRVNMAKNHAKNMKNRYGGSAYLAVITFEEFGS